MKKIILLFIFLTTVSFDSRKEAAFTVGEWFKFRVHYGIVNAGYATLEVKEAVLNKRKFFMSSGGVIPRACPSFFSSRGFIRKLHRQDNRKSLSVCAENKRGRLHQKPGRFLQSIRKQNFGERLQAQNRKNFRCSHKYPRHFVLFLLFAKLSQYRQVKTWRIRGHRYVF